MKGYSGGMRRRLDLAGSLMTRPPVLFLDEPTTGLDPTSRQRVWEAIRELLGEGVTVLLTTQYLEEADALANRIVVVDHGRVIAEGTPQELKEASRGARLEVTLAATAPRRGGRHGAAGGRAPVEVSDDGRRLSAGVDASTGFGHRRSCGRSTTPGVLVDNIEVRQPSLDDVFFSLTGGHIEEEGAEGGDDASGGGAGDAARSGRDRRRRRGPSRAGRSTRMTTTTLTPTATGFDRPAVGGNVSRFRWRTSGP